MDKFKQHDLVRVKDMQGMDLIGEVGFVDESGMLAIDFKLSDSSEHSIVYTVVDADRCTLVSGAELFKAKLEGKGVGIANESIERFQRLLRQKVAKWTNRNLSD